MNSEIAKSRIGEVIRMIQLRVRRQIFCYTCSGAEYPYKKKMGW